MERTEHIEYVCHSILNYSRREGVGEDSLSNELNRMASILSALASVASLKIFYEAKDGITSSTEIIKRTGLTQRRYYLRLNRLLETGLLQKRGNMYVHTTLGRLFYELSRILMKAIRYSDRLGLIDKIRVTTSLLPEEKEEVIRAISKSSPADLADLLDGDIKISKVITDPKESISMMGKLIDKAEREVYLAAEYLNPYLTKTILDSIERGVKVNLIVGGEDYRDELLRPSSPRRISMLNEILGSDVFSFRYVDKLPYVFLIVDDGYVLIEMPRLNPDDPFISLIFENKLLSSKLRDLFKGLKGYEERAV